jgi:hypothetical protein
MFCKQQWIKRLSYCQITMYTAVQQGIFYPKATQQTCTCLQTDIGRGMSLESIIN